MILRTALNKAVKIRLVKGYQSANTGAIESDVVDMQGYDGVLFVSTIDVANSGNYIKAQEGDAANLGDAADLLGTKVICTIAQKPIWVDVFRPRKRYIRLHVTRTASTACGEIYAVQYGGTKLPDSNAVALVIQGEEHISPIAGTA